MILSCVADTKKMQNVSERTWETFKQISPCPEREKDQDGTFFEEPTEKRHQARVV
jgi:hypothetical protein